MARHTAHVTIIVACAVALAGCGVVPPTPPASQVVTPSVTASDPGAVQPTVPTPDQTAVPVPPSTPSASPTPDQPDAQTVAFSPHATKKSDPARFHVVAAIQQDGKIVKSYKRKAPINFGTTYTSLPGVITFRGDNQRSTSSYGQATLTKKKLTSTWSVATGSLPKQVKKAPPPSTSPTPSPAPVVAGSWSGNGWTGQPLLVQWPDATRKVLDRTKAARDKKGLVEAIYASMDGRIYFLDAETGQRTREPVNLGFPFKGAGALDPRGIPLLYVGSGDNSPSGAASHVFVVNLVNGHVLYEFGAHDSFAPRGWTGMDSSALVDAATDTLIYCGENGVIYTMRLGTKWNQATGKLTIKPHDIVKYRYKTSRTSTAKYWLGIESSPVVLGHYLIAGDNGGNLFCLDLNTMKMIWLADVLDDTNGSPVLDFDADGKPYIYISTSLHWTAKNSAGNIPIWKIDATTGEKVWQRSYPCLTVPDVSGGVQATTALGKNNVSDLVFVPVARTPTISAGRLVALDKKTGKEVWAFKTPNYSWSSPVLVYDAKGDGYLIYGDSGGTIHLLDARTGKQLDTFRAGANIEATPSVFDNRVVVGTRGQKIWGLKLS